MSTSSTTDSDNTSTEQSGRRRVLVFPGADKDFATDEEDCLIIHKLLELWEKIGDLARKSNLDSNCREDVRGERKMFFALALHRARSRIIKTIKTNVPKLWPLLLTNASRAFDAFNRYPSRRYSVSKPDAVYQLLVDGRESFVRILVNRNANDVRTETKSLVVVI